MSSKKTIVKHSILEPDLTLNAQAGTVGSEQVSRRKYVFET